MATTICQKNTKPTADNEAMVGNVHKTVGSEDRILLSQLWKFTNYSTGYDHAKKTRYELWHIIQPYTKIEVIPSYDSKMKHEHKYRSL
jgi:hypothetical protein